MCLDTGKELRKTDKKPTHGWKVFHKVSHGYEFPCCLWMGSARVPTSQWLTAEKNTTNYEIPSRVRPSYSMCGTITKEYETGFHVFKTRNAAVEWVCPEGDDPEYTFVKVKISGVRIRGKQDGLVTYIADKMFVPKPKKGKK